MGPPVPEWLRLFLLLYHGGFTVFAIVVMAQFFRKRHSFFLQARSPRLTLLELATAVIAWVSHELVMPFISDEEARCFMTIVWTHTWISLVLLWQVMRAWALFWRVFVGRQRAKRRLQIRRNFHERSKSLQALLDTSSSNIVVPSGPPFPQDKRPSCSQSKRPSCSHSKRPSCSQSKRSKSKSAERGPSRASSFSNLNSTSDLDSGNKHPRTPRARHKREPLAKIVTLANKVPSVAAPQRKHLDAKRDRDKAHGRELRADMDEAANTIRASTPRARSERKLLRTVSSNSKPLAASSFHFRAAKFLVPIGYNIAVWWHILSTMLSYAFFMDSYTQCTGIGLWLQRACTISFYSIGCVSSMVLLSRMGGFRDNFGIFVEMRRITAVYVLSSAIMVGVMVVGYLEDPAEDWDPVHMAPYVLQIMFVICGVTPLVDQARHERRVSECNFDHLSCMEDILSDGAALVALRAFMKREFCDEMLEFYEAASLYARMHTVSTPDEQIRSAYVLYCQYVAKGAPSEINIPGKVTENIRHVLFGTYDASTYHIHSIREAPIDIFAEAQMEIARLIHSGPLLHFLMERERTLAAKAKESASPSSKRYLGSRSVKSREREQIRK